jgi:hypothetical protein
VCASHRVCDLVCLCVRFLNVLMSISGLVLNARSTVDVRDCSFVCVCVFLNLNVYANLCVCVEWLILVAYQIDFDSLLGFRERPAHPIGFLNFKYFFCRRLGLVF